MRVAYLGNFGPSHSTENHVALSLEALGYEVHRLQEGSIRALDVPSEAIGDDVFLWTQTKSLADQSGTIADRLMMLDTITANGLPTVAFHLDRWHGLHREHQVAEEPFFQCDLVVTADGGHEDEFAAAGVRHLWLPPAVYHGEAYDGSPVIRQQADVAFVGAWHGYGHEEWRPYRDDLIARLREWYGPRFKVWPRAGRPALRGAALNDLYASTKVVVGDSCLAGEAKRYWSDRIPETIGRGGFIVHPEVEGLLDVHPYVPTWPLGDWDRLHDLIDHHLEHEIVRERIRMESAIDVRAHHTYKNRMQTVLDHVAGMFG